jgi:hypothetical protein
MAAHEGAVVCALRLLLLGDAAACVAELEAASGGSGADVGRPASCSSAGAASGAEAAAGGASAGKGRHGGLLKAELAEAGAGVQASGAVRGDGGNAAVAPSKVGCTALPDLPAATHSYARARA